MEGVIYICNSFAIRGCLSQLSRSLSLHIASFKGTNNTKLDDLCLALTQGKKSHLQVKVSSEKVWTESLF